VSAEVAAFARRVRGHGFGRQRQVLLVAAPPEVTAALRAEGFAVLERDEPALDSIEEHSLDGIWLGSREHADPATLALALRALHHGFVRVPLDRADPADEPRVELMLERADLWVVERFDGLIAWTKLVTPKVGAGAVVLDDRRRVLLCERADGRGWCLPGGYADPLEAPQETVVREVREEVGLEVEVEALLGLYSVALRRGGKIVVCEFFCRVVGGEATTTDETTAFGWFEEHDLPERLFSTHRLRIADAYAVLRGEVTAPILSDSVEPSDPPAR
jgi:ADP-ribose pyrophosphatase YjhB (NUDIX family)